MTLLNSAEVPYWAGK